jgi:hypothetical protein
MARVQSNKKAPQQKKGQQNQKSQRQTRVERDTVSPRSRQPTKNEILIFRVGIIAIAITVVIVSIIFATNYFDEDVEPGVYDDYLHITTNDLMGIMVQDGAGIADFTYFNGRAGYDDHAERLMNQDNTTVYIYLYRSSAIHEDIKEALFDVNSIETMSVFLIDLDMESSENLETLAEYEFSGVDEETYTIDTELENQLLIFDDVEQTFELIDHSKEITWAFEDMNA